MKHYFIKITLDNAGKIIVLHHCAQVDKGMTIYRYMDAYTKALQKRKVWGEVFNKQQYTKGTNEKKYDMFSFILDDEHGAIQVTMQAEQVPALHFYILKEYLQ